MKVRTIPQEYDAIVFNGVTPEVKEFIAKSYCGIHERGENFVLSSMIGNQNLEVGDLLYRSNLLIDSIGIIKKDLDYSEYLEVIE